MTHAFPDLSFLRAVRTFGEGSVGPARCETFDFTSFRRGLDDILFFAAVFVDGWEDGRDVQHKCWSLADRGQQLQRWTYDRL